MGFIFLFVFCIPQFTEASVCDRLFLKERAPVELEQLKLPLPPSSRSQKTEDMQHDYSRVRPYVFWQKWIDNELDFLRFIRGEDYKSWKDHLHGTEMYGVENFLSWRRGDRYLMSIPVGKITLSIHLFMETHRYATATISPVMKVLDPILPNGFFADQAGVLKKRDSYGWGATKEAISEEAYQALMANDWLGPKRFIETRDSRPGARKGRIQYASHREVEAKLEKLIAWYNANKDTMDPADLCADFQRAYVSIHPTIDGNGRTSRLLMNRLLAEHGLPPALLENSSNDLYSTPEQWRQHVREGIRRYLDIARNQFQSELKEEGGIDWWLAEDAGWMGWNDEIPTNYTKSAGLQLQGLLRHPFVSSKMAPGRFHREFQIGGFSFVMLSDGFLYSYRGVPHIYHEGKLYPIVDKAYFLYEFGGKYSEKREETVADGWKEGEYGLKEGEKFTQVLRMRGMSPVQKDLYRNHFRLLRRLENHEVDGDRIEVVDYREISAANERGELYLYPWQKEVFRNAAEIRDTDPFAILMQERDRQSSFEHQIDSLPENVVPKPSDVVAQYEKLDLHYFKLQQYAKKHHPELVEMVLESRRKIHGAARELLKDNLVKLYESTTPEEREKYQSNPVIRLLLDYFPYLKISYESFDEGLKKLGDKDVYLLRSDYRVAGKLGFYSQEDYKRWFTRLPGSQKFALKAKELFGKITERETHQKIREKLKSIQEAIDQKESWLRFFPEKIQILLKDIEATYTGFILGPFQALIDSIFTSRYVNRGTALEYERTLIDFYLHAEGDIPVKMGTSFSSSVALYYRNFESWPFPYSSEGRETRLHIVRLPKARVEWNYSSGFSGEYEFLSVRPIVPWRTVQRYSTEDIFGPIKEMQELDLPWPEYWNSSWIHSFERSAKVHTKSGKKKGEETKPDSDSSFDNDPNGGGVDPFSPPDQPPWDPGGPLGDSFDPSTSNQLVLPFEFVTGDYPQP